MSSGAVPQRSITIHGFTPAEQIKATIVLEYDEDSEPYELTKVVVPDSGGAFVVDFKFKRGKGVYGFLFWVFERGEYRQSNYFTTTIN